MVKAANTPYFLPTWRCARLAGFVATTFLQDDREQLHDTVTIRCLRCADALLSAAMRSAGRRIDGPVACPDRRRDDPPCRRRCPDLHLRRRRSDHAARHPGRPGLGRRSGRGPARGGGQHLDLAERQGHRRPGHRAAAAGAGGLAVPGLLRRLLQGPRGRRRRPAEGAVAGLRLRRRRRAEASSSPTTTSSPTPTRSRSISPTAPSSRRSWSAPTPRPTSRCSRSIRS